MTITALTLAVVGSWSYAGFLAEPAPQPTPPPATTTTTSPSSNPAVTLTSLKTPPSTPSEVAPPVVEQPKLKVAPISEPKAETPLMKSEPAPKAAALGVSTAALPTPTLYRSTDASGQVWEHADPAYLASFVESRNRSIVIYTQAPSWPGRASRCSNGRCN